MFWSMSDNIIARDETYQEYMIKENLIANMDSNIDSIEGILSR